MYTKQFAKCYISLQDNLTEDEKVTLTNFVDEASDLQVKYLLYFGEMYQEHVITESPLYDLDAKFKVDRGKLHKQYIDASKSLKQSMQSPDYYGKTAMQKHRIWQPKQKAIDLKIEKQFKDLKGSYEAARKKLLGSGNTALARKKLMGAASKKSYSAQSSLSKSGPDFKKIFMKKMKQRQAHQMKVAKTQMKITASIAMAALVIMASYKVYQRFMSQAAKNCRGKSGSEKTLCMDEYRDKAVRIRIKNLQSQLPKCNGTVEPDKCKEKIMKQISSLSGRL